MWRTVKVGDVIEKTETVNPTSKFPNESFEYIDVSSVSKERLAIEETQTLLGKDAPSRARRRVHKDDVIFATVRPTLKRVAVVPMELDGQICSTGYIVLRVKQDVLLPRYLFHWMSSQFVMDYVESVQTGASYPAVTDKQVKEIDIHLPPLAEQQRIVAKLDAAFAEIDRTIESATSRQSKLGVLKEAAIDSHFQSLQNETKMGDVFEFVRGPFGGSLKKNMFVAEGFAVYEQQHAIKNQCREFRYFVPQDKFDEMSRFRVSPNAILMSCSGTIGKTTIIPPDFVEGIINQALLMLKPNDRVTPKFATLYMDSKRFSQQLMERVEGAAQKNVASVKVLKEILIPLPNIEEQQQLVSQIEKILSEIEVAQSINESKVNNYMQLKSAILAQELQPPQSEAA